MFVREFQYKSENSFAHDTLDWFMGRQHGHMGKWQYLEAKSATDPCRGNELWDIWENLSQEGNMLNRQKQVIKDHASSMAALTGPVSQLIDLGPGGEHAVESNTLPYIHAYGDCLRDYTAIDINRDFASWAAEQVGRACPAIKAHAINNDFYSDGLALPFYSSAAVLFNGGTIGNFQAEQNTPNALSLMSSQIKKLRHNMPKNSYLF
ncbi:MAG: hypothetical protein DI626_08525, partial [Micavibrio aeruginosavorus]